MTTTEKIIIGAVVAIGGYFVYTKIANGALSTTANGTTAINPDSTGFTGFLGSIGPSIGSIFNGLGSGTGGNITSGLQNILGSGTIDINGGDVTASGSVYDPGADQSDDSGDY